MRMTEKKQKIAFLMALLGIGFAMSGCVKAPNSKEIDGVEVVERVKKQEQTTADAKKTNMKTPDIVLKNMPEHVQWELTNGDNQLLIDAEVIVPKNAVTLYTGTVEMEEWNEENRNRLTNALMDAGYIGEDAEIEVQKQDDVWTSLYCFDEGLVTKEKQGILQDKNGKENEECLDHICSILEKEDLFLDVEPVSWKGEEGNNFYEFRQIFEKLPVMNDFPTTGINDVIKPGGNISIYEGQVISFDLWNLFRVIDKQKCENLAVPEKIRISLQNAIDSYEISFSREICAVKMELGYLLKRSEDKIKLIPVWNFNFDLDSYYDFLDEHPEEREKMTMVNLCVNAIDGSVEYAI